MKIEVRGHGWEEEIEAEETFDGLFVEKEDLFKLLKKTGEKTDLFETIVNGEHIDDHLE